MANKIHVHYFNLKQTLILYSSTIIRWCKCSQVLHLTSTVISEYLNIVLKISMQCFVSNVMVRKRYFTFQLQWSLSSDYILKFLSVMLSTLPLDYYISSRIMAFWVRFSIIWIPKDIIIFFLISRDRKKKLRKEHEWKWLYCIFL